MSVIADFMVIYGILERDVRSGGPIGEVNRLLTEVDTERHQEFRQLNTDQAGGLKVFTNDVWAGAFNHLLPEDVRGAICSANWRYPEEVLIFEESADYGIAPRVRSVADLRTSSEHGDDSHRLSPANPNTQKDEDSA